MVHIFEAKFEIDPASEQYWVKKLGLEFVREYSDTDYYLESPAEETLKLKFLPNETIVFTVVFEDGCFSIRGENIPPTQKTKLLQTNPITVEINRRKRQYLWKAGSVKIDFDYVRQFPNRLFLEAHSSDTDGKERVFHAKDMLQKAGLDRFITVPYNQLPEAKDN